MNKTFTQMLEPLSHAEFWVWGLALTLFVAILVFIELEVYEKHTGWHDEQLNEEERISRKKQRAVEVRNRSFHAACVTAVVYFVLHTL